MDVDEEEAVQHGQDEEEGQVQHVLRREADRQRGGGGIPESAARLCRECNQVTAVTPVGSYLGEDMREEGGQRPEAATDHLRHAAAGTESSARRAGGLLIQAQLKGGCRPSTTLSECFHGHFLPWIFYPFLLPRQCPHLACEADGLRLPRPVDKQGRGRH